MSATTIARQPKGVPTGGQFAATARTEAAVDLDDEFDDDACSDCGGDLSDNEGYDGKCGTCADAEYREALVDEVIDEIEDGREFDLVYVAHDDKLTDAQVSDVLAGKWTAVDNEVDRVFWEDKQTEAERVAKELLEGLDRDWDELGEDGQQRVLDAINDHDGSDPVGRLFHQTPKQLMRTSLGPVAAKAGAAAYVDDVDDAAFAARCQAVTDTLAEHGLDTSAPEVREAVEELVANGPHHWHEAVDLEVIWYGDLETAMPRPRSDADWEDADTKALSFTDPYVLLIDRVNGSGHDVRVPGSLRKDIPRNNEEVDLPREQRVYLDSNAGGWSWDKVCGLVKGAYATEVTGAWA